MGVESRRYDQQVGREVVEPRQDRRFERLAERVAAVAGAQRGVDDLVVLAGLAERAGAGIERHLVGRGVHDGRIAPEDVLGAVAVVDVEIDDGDALDAMGRLGVPGGDRRVVEEAEAHRRRRLGVVAGRPVWRRRRCRRGASTTSSTANVAPPAERNAASKVPGDIAVSESSWIAPWVGLARRIAST